MHERHRQDRQHRQTGQTDNEPRHIWQYDLHPPHLITVATLPCESQNTENVILQRYITKEHCTRCIIASSKLTRVIICLKFTYEGCYTAMRVWNKDSWHWWPSKTLDANLVWLWPGRHQQCDWPVTWPSESVSAGGHLQHTLWHECSMIYVIHQNIWSNSQFSLMHVTAILQLTLKTELVFIFGFNFYNVVYQH